MGKLINNFQIKCLFKNEIIIIKANGRSRTEKLFSLGDISTIQNSSATVSKVKTKVQNSYRDNVIAWGADG